MSTGEGDGIGYSTARGRDWPSVRQFNVFLENRLGALLDGRREKGAHAATRVGECHQCAAVHHAAGRAALGRPLEPSADELWPRIEELDAEHHRKGHHVADLSRGGDIAHGRRSSERARCVADHRSV